MRAPQWIKTDWFIWASSYLPMYLVAVPVFMLLLRKIPDNAAPEQHKLSPKTLLTYFILCMGAVYICNIVSVGINAGIALLKGSPVVNPLEMAVTNSGLLYNLLIGCIVAPIGEEFFFRKWLYKKVGRYGERLYVLLGGLLFALMHANLSQLLYAFVLGAVFCYIYAKTGKLWYTIALYIIINLIGTTVGPLLVQNEIGAVVFSCTVIAFMIAASVLFALYSHKATYAAGAESLAHPVKAALCNVGMLSYIILCSLLIVAVFFVPA